MDEKLRQAEETASEAHLLRRDGHKKISAGHLLLGGATEPDALLTKQTCLRIFEAHKLISEGHALLAKSEEMLASITRGTS